MPRGLHWPPVARGLLLGRLAVAAAALATLASASAHGSAGATRIDVDDSDRLVVTNGDGRWVIWKRFDPASKRSPGVISEFRPRGQKYLYVNDASRSPLRLQGGLGGFSFHWARRDGHSDQPRPGDDSPYLEFRDPDDLRDVDIETGSHAWPMFADQDGRGGFGVGGVRVHREASLRRGVVRFGTTVEFRDGWRDPIVSVRYDYEFYDSGVRLWVGVTTHCNEGDCGRASAGRLGFVKEPRLIASLAPRPDGRLIYPHASILSEDGRRLDEAYVARQPEDTEGPQKHIASSVLERGASVIRFDDGRNGCRRSVHECFFVVARAYPGGAEPHRSRTFRWANDRHGFWAWALASNERPCYSRYGVKRGTGYPSSCNPPTSEGTFGDSFVGAAVNAHGRRGLVKAWNITRRKPVGFAAAKLYAWKGCVGAYDCPIASRTTGEAGETWGVYLSFSYGGGYDLHGRPS